MKLCWSNVSRRGLRSPSSNDGELRPLGILRFGAWVLEKLPGKSFILFMSILIYFIALRSGY